MTYHELKSSLASLYPQGEAAALARIVMEERFGLSQTDLLLGKDSQLSAEDRDELTQIAVRLLKNEPLQYVLGYADFCGMRLRVAPGCLIPRPETAELIRAIEQFFISHPTLASPTGTPTSTLPVCRALDIGTGSGCIALSLAQKGWQVEAWDVSQEALAIARLNAAEHALHINFQICDILAEQNADSILADCSLVVSNPPYVRQSEAAEMHRNVLDYEPHLALFVPDRDPLIFYRAIAAYASRRLQPGGLLAFEINQYLAEETAELVRLSGFTQVCLFDDAFGAPRILLAIQPA
ncbi:MAG: peptide chain release factor N(5)-glutamine methyltransferase [Bacteroidales bacterium]|nr:peptide chain release factor N(5)-glutamine methyltransferase [Candidatus Physcousia equi]